MLRMFWTLSLSGAEDGVGYGDVSPYFIANFREFNGYRESDNRWKCLGCSDGARDLDQTSGKGSPP